MRRNETITVDFKIKDYDQIRLKQLDTTELVFKILDNGNAVDLNNKTAQIIFTRPDRKIVIQDCTVSSAEKKINIILSENCVKVSGLAKIELIVKENSETISSFYINAFIEKTSKENIAADDTKLYLEEFEENIKEMNDKVNKDVRARVDELVQESISDCREQNILVSSLIPTNTEYTLPCKYRVGNKSLRVHWENVLLEEGENGNYMEVGEPEQTSDKIKFGWDIEPGETLIIETRGVVDE